MVMKKFLVMFLMLIGLAAFAKEEEVFVLPLYMTDLQNNNSYGFETASEIVADDIIQNFLLGNKVNSPRLETVKALMTNDYTLREVGEKFRKSSLIDFEKLAKTSKFGTSDKILLVAGYVEDKNGAKLDLWDTLKLASDFQIDYPYVLTTKVVLIDNEGVALWQKSYSMPLASGKKAFNAQNFSKAAEQYEKVRSFSKNIIAKDVEQNLVLRLNNKSIDFSGNIKKSPAGAEGVGLKYYKRGIPVKITPPSESIEQQLLKDDSFSL